MKEMTKGEIWMGSFLLIAVCFLSTLGMKKAVQSVLTLNSEKNVIVLDAGHGGGNMRSVCI